MSEATTYAPDKGFLGRLWEGQRLQNIDLLISSSFGFYEGFIRRIENAGGITQFAQEKNLPAERVRDVLFQTSLHHAYPVVTGRYRRRRAENRFAHIQQALFLVFEYTPEGAIDVSLLQRSEATVGLFDSPQLPYEFSGDLRTIMHLEAFFPDDFVLEMYMFIARTRAGVLIEGWRQGLENIRTFLILQSATRRQVFPSEGARAEITSQLNDHPGGQFEQALFNTMYFDQLVFIFKTLASRGYGSIRVVDVLDYYAAGDLPIDSVPGVAIDTNGDLIRPLPILESERVFVDRLLRELTGE